MDDGYAEDHGLVDQFVEQTCNHDPGCDPTLGMDYFDGNTPIAIELEILRVGAEA